MAYKEMNLIIFQINNHTESGGEEASEEPTQVLKQYFDYMLQGSD